MKCFILIVVAGIGLSLNTSGSLAAPPLPDDATDAVLWVQNSAEYYHSCRQTYWLANLQLQRGLHRRSWTADLVQERDGHYSDKQPAVILDVDETVLDNSAYNARLILKNQERVRNGEKPAGFDPVTWGEWVQERKAPLLPGVREFVLNAHKQGVAVYFVTNRSDAEKKDTIANLTDHGLPATDENVLTRNDDAGRGKDKMSRRATIAERHRIVLLIGDTIGDFRGEVDIEDQQKRNSLARAREDWLGVRWLILPNPIYGGWTKPIRSLPSKLDALRLQTTP